MRTNESVLKLLWNLWILHWKVISYFQEGYFILLINVMESWSENFLFRFAQFFLCPLFDESCKDREVNAVDSEHEKNLMNDAWRLFQLEKATGNPNHPFSKFGTGLSENYHSSIRVLCSVCSVIIWSWSRLEWNNSDFVFFFSAPCMFIIVLYCIFHMVDQTKLDKTCRIEWYKTCMIVMRHSLWFW